MGESVSPKVGTGIPHARRCARAGAGSSVPGMSKRLPIASLVAAAGALALAACAPGQPSQPAAAGSPVNVRQVYHRLAQCVRDHGLPDFPDPTFDANGRPQLPPGVARPSDQVMQACASIENELPPQDRPPTDSHPDPVMMRRFAQCMRDHGIQDWPDPDSLGQFNFPPALANLKSGPRWPRIQANWNGPCKQYDPSGHIEAAR